MNDLRWFQTRTNGMTLESDSIRRADIYVALNMKQVIEIGRLVRLHSLKVLEIPLY